jgi:hypothetical protein
MTDDRAPRKRVKLSGTAVLCDGTSLALDVLDLSITGCKVQSSHPLNPGVALTISIAGLATPLQATVRWYRAGTAGLQFATEDHEPEPEHPTRQHDRLGLSGNVWVRRPGRSSYQLRMFDLTRTGCRVEFVERPKEGETVWAKFESLDAVQAVVRWLDGFYGGIEFVRPIHPSVFALLLRRLQG